MAPSRIMIMRHGESHDAPGVDAPNTPDKHSLDVRGWQRAGALVRFFRPLGGTSDMTPDSIFASKIAEGSETKRPQQTVAPLAALLGLPVRADHPKSAAAALMAEVVREEGTVLIAWEHSVIPDLVAALPGSPASVPGEWPSERYDLVWIFDRRADGWRFSQARQDVLA